MGVDGTDGAGDSVGSIDAMRVGLCLRAGGMLAVEWSCLLYKINASCYNQSHRRRHY